MTFRGPTLSCLVWTVGLMVISSHQKQTLELQKQLLQADADAHGSLQHRSHILTEMAKCRPFDSSRRHQGVGAVLGFARATISARHRTNAQEALMIYLIIVSNESQRSSHGCQRPKCPSQEDASNTAKGSALRPKAPSHST